MGSHRTRLLTQSYPTQTPTSSPRACLCRRSPPPTGEPPVDAVRVVRAQLACLQKVAGRAYLVDHARLERALLGALAQPAAHVSLDGGVVEEARDPWAEKRGRMPWKNGFGEINYVIDCRAESVNVRTWRGHYFVNPIDSRLVYQLVEAIDEGKGYQDGLGEIRVVQIQAGSIPQGAWKTS